MRCMICKCLTVQENKDNVEHKVEDNSTCLLNEIVQDYEQDFFEEDPAEYLEDFEAFLLEYQEVNFQDKTKKITGIRRKQAMVLYDQEVLQRETIGKHGFLDDSTFFDFNSLHIGDSEYSEEDSVKCNKNELPAVCEIENERRPNNIIDNDARGSASNCWNGDRDISEEKPVATEIIPGEEVTESTNASPKTRGIREKAYKLCREYLYGSWREISQREFELRRISGGLSNLLFYCALPPNHPPIQGEPSRVLLRLYGQIHGEKALEGLITESVIFTLLSESQRGPKLFGIFPGGRIEEYIPARPLHTDELSDPQMSCLIAEKMALVHLMEVPINKEPHWLWDTMSRWMNSIQKFVNQNHISTEDKKRVEQVISYHLEAEQQWLMKFLKRVNSPVVFCHNDLQEGNILLRSTNKNNQQCDIVIIDFEYCSYNYRGFDFANHMCEWMYDYSNKNEPYFWERNDKYPTCNQQKLFIESYLKMKKRQLGLPEKISKEEIESLLKEIETFTLASHFFWGLWSIVNSNISTIPFGYWQMAGVKFRTKTFTAKSRDVECYLTQNYGEARFRAYFKQKERILKWCEAEQHSFAQ